MTILKTHMAGSNVETELISMVFSETENYRKNSVKMSIVLVFN